MFQQHSQQTYCRPATRLLLRKEKKIISKNQVSISSSRRKKKTMSENNTLMETMSSDRNFTYVSSYHCVSYSPSSTFLTKVDAVIVILWLASKCTFYGKTYRNFIRDNEQWLLNLVAKCHYLLALAPYLCLEVEKGRCQLQQWHNEERQVITALFPALSPSPQPLQVAERTSRIHFRAGENPSTLGKKTGELSLWTESHQFHVV